MLPCAPVAPVDPFIPLVPVAPVAPFVPLVPVAPVAPVVPVAPCAPVSPVAPTTPTCTSCNTGWWLVVVLSLLSKNKAVFDTPSTTKPKLDAGVFSHFTKLDVTSTDTNWLAPETAAVPTWVADDGALELVTAPSLQAEAASETLIVPAVPSLFTHKTKLARATDVAVVPAGSVDKSNCRKVRDVSPVCVCPTLSCGRLPKFRPGVRELTCVSPDGNRVCPSNDGDAQPIKAITQPAMPQPFRTNERLFTCVHFYHNQADRAIANSHLQETLGRG